MADFQVEGGITSASSVIPYFTVGSIISTIKTSAPTGWLLCNGTEYSKTGTYATLFAKIGTRYGETNGSGGVGTSHFRVPNLVSNYLFPMSSGAAATGGATNHSHTVNANATSNNVAVTHNHAVAQAGFGGGTSYHSHGNAGTGYVGANGTNPLNANKTGTGGGGYGSGGAHVHDGYSFANTNADGTNASYHNVDSLGINGSTGAAHTHTSATAISGTSTWESYVIPSFTVNFMIKV